MRQTFSMQFYCRESKQTRNGSPIELALSINGKRTFICLPRKMSPKEFLKDMSSKRSNPTKGFCKSYEIRVNEAVQALLDYNKPITAINVKNALVKGVATCFSVEEVFKEHLKLMADKTKGGLSLGTYKKYELSFDLFLKTIGDKDINDVTNSDIEKYIAAVNSSHKAATTRGYVLRVKSAFIQARQDGKLKKDPFIGIKVRNPRQKLEILTEEEYNRILNKRFSIPRLEKVRKLFILGCSTGLSYCDLMNLKIDDVKEKDGIKYIEKERNKTGVTFTAVVLDDAIPILSELEDLKISNQKCNSYLAEIEDLCEIKHHLTVHKSRHYYCTRLLRKGIPTTVVQKCMGHSKLTMTQHYEHIIKDDILNAFKG